METFNVSFTTFVATIGPLDVAAIFVGLTATVAPTHRRSMTIRGTVNSAILLLCFALLGDLILSFLGISLSALYPGFQFRPHHFFFQR
jgi:multiple antibiotic resistance protein